MNGVEIEKGRIVLLIICKAGVARRLSVQEQIYLLIIATNGVTSNLCQEIGRAAGVFAANSAGRLHCQRNAGRRTSIPSDKIRVVRFRGTIIVMPVPTLFNPIRKAF